MVLIMSLCPDADKAIAFKAENPLMEKIFVAINNSGIDVVNSPKTTETQVHKRNQGLSGNTETSLDIDILNSSHFVAVTGNEVVALGSPMLGVQMYQVFF